MIIIDPMFQINMVSDKTKRIFFVYENYTGDENSAGEAYIARDIEHLYELCPQAKGLHVDDKYDTFQWNVNDLAYGKIDDMEGLRREIYAYIWGICPNCHKEGKLYWDSEDMVIWCEGCY